MRWVWPRKGPARFSRAGGWWDNTGKPKRPARKSGCISSKSSSPLFARSPMPWFRANGWRKFGRTSPRSRDTGPGGASFHGAIPRRQGQLLRGAEAQQQLFPAQLGWPAPGSTNGWPWPLSTKHLGEAGKTKPVPTRRDSLVLAILSRSHYCFYVESVMASPTQLRKSKPNGRQVTRLWPNL